MKTLGIIAEFNPFHNGHKYLIDMAKNITHADNVVILCSGNFVQRGTPAVIDKSIRTQMALDNGADIVFELPVFYSTASAELFAKSSVSFFTGLKCIDYLCFGCETDNIDNLSLIADTLCDEPELYKEYLGEYLKQGFTFPKSRMLALCRFFNESDISCNVEEIISSPNNILAIEYLKAIKYLNSDLIPIPVKRVGAGYDSVNLNQEFASATGIRNEMINEREHSIQGLVPDNCIKHLTNADFLLANDFSSILGYKLLTEDNFIKYFGIGDDLANRIAACRHDFYDVESFILKLQSKNQTYSAISRALLHIILDIRKSDMDDFINNSYFTCARMLGFQKGTKLLSVIKEKSNIDIIGKLASYYNTASTLSKKMLDLCIQADELYRMVYMHKYKKSLPTEFERQIVIRLL